MRGTRPDKAISRAVKEVFGFRPWAIIEVLSQRDPIPRATAACGHYGREPEELSLDNGKTVRSFSWEATGRVEELREVAGG